MSLDRRDKSREDTKGKDDDNSKAHKDTKTGLGIFRGVFGGGGGGDSNSSDSDDDGRDYDQPSADDKP